MESGRGQRDELLRPLAKVAANAALLVTLCQSPAQMLGRIVLGDARRTQYQAQFEGAGPVELETAAITAITAGDMPLAAAVATVVDSRTSERRPFSVAAFAERVRGTQHAEVTTKLKGVLLAERTARAANDEFVRGKADPIANLSNQLAARAITEAGGDDEA